ncbi:unnamed protein product [Acanthoscelides obtectus]|uniref:Protein-tyrosine-phosphatase n=1 Tax=Acanthoscelides obtectus TaxID=200917 RepID=A0A9P0LYT1_ACAOB|nr:unnamed protein product [Acanthoscelides obtectus]CAK1636548.1 Dual specificity protein phosphatase 1B [Acanthoscelides obtectus]
MYLSRFTSSFNRGAGYVYELDEIEPKLYLSGADEASSVETLKKYKITHILTINDYPLTPSVKEELGYINKKFICLPDMVTSDLLSYFDECYEFIREGVSRGAVLVHCQMGVSRSATIVIAYLMKKYRIKYREALDKVRARRCVYPNPGFVSQLEKYSEMGYNTMNRFAPRSRSSSYYR